jgi:hypothetical protein
MSGDRYLLPLTMKRIDLIRQRRSLVKSRSAISGKAIITVDEKTLNCPLQPGYYAVFYDQLSAHRSISTLCGAVELLLKLLHFFDR